MQDYKCQRAAVTTYATLVNILARTHTQAAYEQLIWIAEPAELKTDGYLQSLHKTGDNACSWLETTATYSTLDIKLQI